MEATTTYFKVYYDTPNGRPAKRFDTGGEAFKYAASMTPDRRAQVVKVTEETVITD